MTLRNASLLQLSLVTSSLVLAGCPGDTSSGDAGQPSVDAFAESDSNVGLVDTCVCFVPDAFVEPDVTTPTTDSGPTDDAGPVVGDSFIADTCGPADGPAISLTLSDALDVSTCSADPEMPSTSFFIHDLGGATLPPTSGATITSTTAASNGAATQCPGGHPPCRTSETWSITFTSYAADGGASGQYNITWEGGETSTGTFQATRCEVGGVICG